MVSLLALPNTLIGVQTVSFYKEVDEVNQRIVCVFRGALLSLEVLDVTAKGRTILNLVQEDVPEGSLVDRVVNPPSLSLVDFGSPLG